MLRTRSFVIHLVILTALLTVVSLPTQAKGKGFKDVVKHIEKEYRAKKKRVPFLGLANFALKFVHPAGVKGFKVAIFENHDFSPRTGETPFQSVMRDAYKKDWQPLVQSRTGGQRSFIYAKPSGKDVQFAIALLEPRQAYVVEVKLNPDAAMKYLSKPDLLGHSLLEGFKLDALAMRNSSQRNSGGSDGLAKIGQKMESAPAPVQVEAKPVAVSSSDETEKANDEADEAPPAAAGDTTANAKPAVRDKDAIRVETQLVNLNVKAVDGNGQPLTTLRKEDFVIFEDGAPQEIAHFAPVTAPINLVLLLDLSGSTEKKRDVMAEAAKKFIESLDAEDRIAVAAFTRETYLLCDFTTDRRQLKKSVDKIKKIKGGTAFYDAMWTTLDWLDKVQDARKAIVVLTDGEDNSMIVPPAAPGLLDIQPRLKTKHTFDELLARVAEKDATIYPIQLPSEEPKIAQKYIHIGPNSKLHDQIRARTIHGVVDRIKRTQEVATQQLQSLAEQTAGTVFKANSEDDLDGVYQRVAAELRTLYSLAYNSNNESAAAKWRNIKVTVNQPGVEARTKRGYQVR